MNTSQSWLKRVEYMFNQMINKVLVIIHIETLFLLLEDMTINHKIIIELFILHNALNEIRSGNRFRQMIKCQRSSGGGLLLIFSRIRSSVRHVLGLIQNHDGLVINVNITQDIESSLLQDVTQINKRSDIRSRVPKKNGRSPELGVVSGFIETKQRLTELENEEEKRTAAYIVISQCLTDITPLLLRTSEVEVEIDQDEKTKGNQSLSRVIVLGIIDYTSNQSRRQDQS